MTGGVGCITFVKLTEYLCCTVFKIFIQPIITVGAIIDLMMFSCADNWYLPIFIVCKLNIGLSDWRNSWFKAWNRSSVQEVAVWTLKAESCCFMGRGFWCWLCILFINFNKFVPFHVFVIVFFFFYFSKSHFLHNCSLS